LNYLILHLYYIFVQYFLLSLNSLPGSVYGMWMMKRTNGMIKGIGKSDPESRRSCTATENQAAEAEFSPFIPTDPVPESAAKSVRRRFTAEYKISILQLAEACTEAGCVGGLLQREGLYASHLAAWRRQRDEGVLVALTPRRTGRKAVMHDPLQEENRNLRRENHRLAKQLKETELFIDIQKKIFTEHVDTPSHGSRERLMRLMETLRFEIGVQPVCKALGIPRSSLYRRRGARRHDSGTRTAL
jgi:transposase-like protein